MLNGWPKISNEIYAELPRGVVESLSVVGDGKYCISKLTHLENIGDLLVRVVNLGPREFHSGGEHRHRGRGLDFNAGFLPRRIRCWVGVVSLVALAFGGIFRETVDCFYGLGSDWLVRRGRLGQSRGKDGGVLRNRRRLCADGERQWSGNQAGGGRNALFRDKKLFAVDGGKLGASERVEAGKGIDAVVADLKC